jgi:hypothetical protein
MYIYRRTSGITLDKLDDPVPKSKTVRAVPRTDGATRKNRVITGQSSPVAATTAEEPQQAVTETTELPPEPELGDLTFYHYSKMLMSIFA